MKRRCAITGAAGYVGSAIAQGFRDQDWDVIGLGRRSSALATAHVPYDLASDPERIAWSGVDALVHAAYDFNLRGWERIHAANVGGSIGLLRAAREGGVKRVVFISSMSAFPGCRSLYGRAKIEIEDAALKLGCEVVRPGLVFGGETGGMIRALERAVGRSPVVPLIGDGSFPQYLAHCEDLARLVTALCQPGAPAISRPISAAHPRGVSFRELLQILARRQGRSPVFMPFPWRWIHLGLRALEAARLPAPFRSDSLVGFVFQNPAPDFNLPEMPEISFRPFA